jgi:beta-glucosidase
LRRPYKELKGFAKVALEPGETKWVEFDLAPRDFAFYDPYLRKWTAEPGEFEILLGSSAQDIRVRKVIRLAQV